MDTTITSHECTRALKICRENLTGAWKDAKLEDLSISKLSGGWCNLLYRCALNGDFQARSDEPREVLLRIYGQQCSDIDLQLEIFKQLARDKLGPRLYGTFDGGRIEEFLPSRTLTRSEMVEDNISAAVAKKIAAIHELEVEPMKRSPDWLTSMYKQLHESNLDSGQTFKCKDDMRESTKAIALRMLAIDFEPEIDFLTHLFENSNAPLVFSHNDLHQNNILLLHGSNKEHGYDDHIVLIDFEFCGYNYRTYDAANYLNECCFDYNGNEYPFFSFSTDWFPSEDQQKQFLSHYIRQLGDSGINDGHVSNGNRRCCTAEGIEILFKEMQIFLMASNMLSALWSIQSACISDRNYGFWEMAQSKWKMFLLCKERYLKVTSD